MVRAKRRQEAEKPSRRDPGGRTDGLDGPQLSIE